MVSLNIQLPDGFLDEEKRCGYTVSQKMKEVWAVELDLLVEFDRVCKKYSINYIASGGTMLGAVRHHGFIPWDDDLDLMLLRTDYNRLCSIASKEFHYPFFFQTEYTDPGFMRGFARLRNSQTTAIQEFESKKKYTFNQGVFIDIFPLDELQKKEALLRRQRKRIKRFYNISYVLSDMTDRYPPSRKSLSKYIYKTIGHFTIRPIINKWRIQDLFFRKFEKCCQEYNDTGQEWLSLLSFQCDNRQHDIRSYKPDHVILLPFEFLKIPIPSNYDEHLKHKYGDDYMTPQKKVTYHGDVHFDTNISYKEKLI